MAVNRKRKKSLIWFAMFIYLFFLFFIYSEWLCHFLFNDFICYITLSSLVNKYSTDITAWTFWDKWMPAYLYRRKCITERMSIRSMTRRGRSWVSNFGSKFRSPAQLKTNHWPFGCFEIAYFICWFVYHATVYIGVIW